MKRVPLTKRTERIEKTEKINFRYLAFLAGTAAMGGLLFGFDIGIITGAGPFLLKHFHLGELGLGWAYSVLLFGCIVGAALAGRAGDIYGRKKILIASGVLFALTSVATGLAPSFDTFILARFFGGIAVGAVSLVSPTYVSEVSPPSLRGRMGALYQLSIVVGILISYTINYSLRNAGPENWRWMFLTGAIPSVIFFAMMLVAPETPRFLLLSGRREESFLLLERISGKDAATFQVQEIAASLQEGRSSWRQLFEPGVRKAVFVGFILSILVQASGINTIIDYAPQIFQSAGWQINEALLSTMFLGVLNLLFTLISFAVIDRFGRRPVYITGSLGMTAALIGLIWTVAIGSFRGTPVLVLIILFLASFEACIGPAYWTLMPEILPNRVRSTAMVVPVLTQWAVTALVVLFFPIAFHQIGKAGTFGFLAIMSLAQALFTWRFVPETKGVPLEEIEAFWRPAQTPSVTSKP